MASSRTKRGLDAIVFGATGDTGSAACRILTNNAAKMGIKAWAPAARSSSKLAALVASLPDPSSSSTGVAPSPSILAESSDFDSLKRMCEQAKVVVACAGPYALYGESVVRACVETGTDYVDVTGEVPWVTKMKAKYGTAASKKGIRLVSFAGYDSVPSDLCTWLVADALKAAGETVGRVETYHAAGGGQMPTGTIETVLLNVGKVKSRLLSLVTLGLLGSGDSASKAKPAKAEDAADSTSATAARSHGSPASMMMPKSEQGLVSKDLLWNQLSAYSTLGGRFSTPHPMAGINTNIVHATAVAQGYGGLEYRERLLVGKSSWESSSRLFPDLYGLPAALLLILGQVVPVLFAFLPFTEGVIRGMVAKANSVAKPRVVANLNAGKPTGFTICNARGESKGDGSVVASSSLRAELDAGIGFTMTSACAVAGWLAQNPHRAGTGAAPAESGDPTVGFTTAVNAVGGQALVDCLRDVGITVTQTPAGPRSRL